MQTTKGYALHPKSCSHAVWYVIKEYVPDQPNLKANDLLKLLERDSRWQSVEVNDLDRYVNDGLIMGLTPANPRGHFGVMEEYPPRSQTSLSGTER